MCRAFTEKKIHSKHTLVTRKPKEIRSNFNPGHKHATPILPASLAYSITAHKCQGWTLDEAIDEVIVDFGSDTELKIKSCIVPSGIYVCQ